MSFPSTPTWIGNAKFTTSPRFLSNPSFPGPPPPPWTPAQLPSLALYQSMTTPNCLTTLGSVAGAGDSVATVNALFGTSNTASQLVPLSQPTFQTSGLQYDAGGSDLMTLSSALSLTGDFSAYMVGNYVSGSDMILLGSSATNGAIGWVFGQLGLYDDSGSQAGGTPSFGGGLFLLRIIRASGTVQMDITGSIGSPASGFTGTVSLDTTGQAPGQGDSNSDTGNRYVMQSVQTAANTIDGATDLAFLNYILTTYGVSL